MALNTIGSGLDIPALVSQLVAAERAPTQNRINNAGAAATIKLSALGSIKSVLTSLQTSLQSLGKAASKPAYATTVAENSGFSATVVTDATTGKTDAAAGSYSVEVVSLSQPQKLASAAFGKDAVVGDGTLTVAWGDTSINVDIIEGSKLSDIADAINKASGGKGVNASVITADGGQHLVLNAVNSGTAGAMKLTTTGGNGGLSALTWDGTSGGLNETAKASDAVVRVDGFERTSSSNTISDIIPGITLNLSKAEPGSTKVLKVSQDNTPLKANLQAFVAAYNAAASILKSSSAYNPTSDSASALTGDSMVRGMQQQLRGMASANVNDLKALGVTISKEGTLSLDTAVLDKTLAADPLAANALFGEKGKLTESMNTMLQSQLDASSGSLSLRTTDLNKQIKKLEADLDALEVRMEKVSTRYTKQFTTMDTLVARMQSTSDYLTQQLSSMSSKS